MIARFDVYEPVTEDNQRRRSPADRFRGMCGPLGVDQHIRNAIATCWLMLPEERRSMENLDAEVRRLVERALQNVREDCQSFGLQSAEKTGR